MKTVVRNLLNPLDVETYVNSYEPKVNLINSVILKRGMSSQLHNEDTRLKIEQELKIVSKTSKNGDKIAFSEKVNLFARQTKI